MAWPPTVTEPSVIESGGAMAEAEEVGAGAALPRDIAGGGPEEGVRSAGVSWAKAHEARRARRAIAAEWLRGAKDMR